MLLPVLLPPSRDATPANAPGVVAGPAPGPEGTEVPKGEECAPLNAAGLHDWSTCDYGWGLDDYAAAIAKAPNNARIFVSRAFFYLRNKDMQSALMDVKKAAELDTKSAMPLIILARFLVRDELNDNRGALQALDRAIALGLSMDRYSDVFYLRAQVLEELGDSDGAISQCLLVLAAVQSFEKAVYSDYCADMLARKGQHYQASELYAQAGLDQVVRAAQSSWQDPAASKIYADRAISLSPNNERLYLLRGDIFLDLDDFPAAMNDYTKAIQIAPSEQAFSKRGTAKYGLADYPGAIQDWSKSIELSKEGEPLRAELFRKRATAKFLLGDSQGSLADLNEALKDNPRDARALYYRGRQKIFLGDRSAGCRDLFDSLYLGEMDAHSATNDLCR